MGVRTEVVVDGDVGPLRKMLREGVSAMNAFQKDTGEGFEQVTGPLESMAKKFSGIVAVIGSGAIFKEAIDETVKFTKENNLLARTLGITATEATAWNVALGDIYQDADALVGAVGKLNRVIAEDEDKLNKLGIATRDASGNLKAQGDIFLEVTGYLSKFKEGTDRNVEGARIFGKSWGDVAPILKLTKEGLEDAAQKANDLGLTMTEESQGRVKAYRASMNDVGDVMLGLKNAVAQAVMPVLTRLGEWFSSVGPQAVTIVRGAINGLTTAFMGLLNGVEIVWETIKSFVFTVSEPIRAIGESLFLLANRDFKGAAAAITGVAASVGQRWSNTMATISDSSRRTAEDIASLWGAGTAIKGQADGADAGERAGKTKKPKADKSAMEGFEAQLAAQKQMLIEGGFIREYEAQQEAEFWRKKLQLANLSADDRLKIERKVAQLSYEVRKQSLDREREMAALSASQAEAMALGKIDTDKAVAKALLDNDQITKLQYLQGELSFEAERYNIQVQALQARLAVLAQDPNSNPIEAQRIKGQLLMIEQQYMRERTVMLSNMSKEMPGADIFKDIQSGFTGSLNSMFNSAQTWGQRVMGLFKTVGGSMINSLISEPLGKYIAGLAKMLAMKLGFISAETAAQTTASGVIAGAKGTEATAVSTANAVEAGTGAAAAVAPTPFIGPFLALAAMATVFAAVSALGSKKSAAGGYDIPSGINPMTQLHEEEMVLPAKYANAIRDMVSGGSRSGAEGGGAAFAPSIQVTTMDSRGVVQSLRRGGALNTALRDAHRAFTKI